MATATECSQLSENDMNEVAKLRGFSSFEEQLMDNIWNKAISWITTHDHHLCHPNCIQWSNQNVLCCVHGPFITIIDMKLLYHGRPLDSVTHECRNDLLSGLKGALSHIHCMNHGPSTDTTSNNTLDCIASVSTPIFINARWCPFPPSLFTQFGLLAVVQSNHVVTIYGMPSFTFYHCSNTVIPAQWTAVVDLTNYVQKYDSTCFAWLNDKDKENDIQYIAIGTKEGFFVVMKLVFTFNKKGFDIQIMNEIETGFVINQIESIEFKSEIFIGVALENGLCQIWNVSTFECIFQMDLQNNGSISCMKWNQSKTDKHSLYLIIAKHRFIYVLEIRIPHKRASFKQYSSSNWMNQKTAKFYPSMGIVGMQIIDIMDKMIIITSSYDGRCIAWNGTNCSPIINDDIYDKLMINICCKLCKEIKRKEITSFGIALDPNGLLIALIHPVKKESKTRLSQGLQSLHLYPVSVDYEIVYNKIRQNDIYLYPTSIAIALDYFIPFHIHLIQTFIDYHQNTFGDWFEIKDENQDLNIDKILESQDSFRYCLLMMRYFVSRIQPFDGMHNNSQLQWLDDHIASIMEVLLQLHCYKTLTAFIRYSNGDQDKNKKEYLSIYLMFIWTLFSYLSNKNKNRITVIFTFLLRLLLVNLKDIFEILNDDNFYAKCNNVHKCLYPDDFDFDEEEEDEEKTQFRMNCKKIEECPICRKLTSVVMHNGPCGSDGDKERHLISRCCVSFKIIDNCHQLYCSCCNGGIAAEITKQLIKQISKADINNIMIRSYSHCKPFVCSLCRVPLIQLL